MKRRPFGVTFIALIYFSAAAVNIGLLLSWLFARGTLLAFVESVTPSASLGPALLEELPGIVTTYFAVMAGLCCGVGWSLWRLHRWAWFVTCGFIIMAFMLDTGLFVQMLPHLSVFLVAVGILRFGLRVWILVYMSRRSTREGFGLVRRHATAA